MHLSTLVLVSITALVAAAPAPTDIPTPDEGDRGLQWSVLQCVDPWGEDITRLCKDCLNGGAYCITNSAQVHWANPGQIAGWCAFYTGMQLGCKCDLRPSGDLRVQEEDGEYLSPAQGPCCRC